MSQMLKELLEVNFNFLLRKITILEKIVYTPSEELT